MIVKKTGFVSALRRRNVTVSDAETYSRLARTVAKAHVSEFCKGVKV